MKIRALLFLYLKYFLLVLLAQLICLSNWRFYKELGFRAVFLPLQDWPCFLHALLVVVSSFLTSLLIARFAKTERPIRASSILFGITHALSLIMLLRPRGSVFFADNAEVSISFLLLMSGIHVLAIDSGATLIQKLKT